MKGFKLYGVCGSPVLHSKSPDIYNMLFQKQSLDARYIRIRPESAAEAVEIYDSLNLSGMNITAPFKEDILYAAAEKDESVIATGAANTFCGRIKSAFNTDVYGVEKSLGSLGAVAGMKSAVLGAGGAAKAVICALKNIGAEVTVINRSYGKAAAAAEEFSVAAAPLSSAEEVFAGSKIIVSTLPGDAASFVLPFLRKDMIILDANYKDSVLETAAAGCGAGFAKGIDWLMHQALRSFEIYTGVMVDPDDAFRLFSPENVSGRKDAVALVGFMGSGKTTVGKILARISGRNFFDIDSLIEKKMKMTINEIFAARGADFFREAESYMLKEVLSEKNSVISCGGGIVTVEKNRSLLKKSALNVWIYASVGASLPRIDSSRPLMNVPDPEAQAAVLFDSRRKFYAETCDLLVYNENKTPEKCAELIYEEIR